jgi:DNA transformation protein
MPATPAFVAHCLELLAPWGEVRARRMFGGHGLYVNSLFIALIADERLYLKADDNSRAAFERAGCAPFAYSRRERASVTLGYWSAPDEALDSPRLMEPWARLALAAALRAKASSQVPAADEPAASARKKASRQGRTVPRAASKRRDAKARG